MESVLYIKKKGRKEEIQQMLEFKSKMLKNRVFQLEHQAFLIKLETFQTTIIYMDELD